MAGDRTERRGVTTVTLDAPMPVAGAPPVHVRAPGLALDPERYVVGELLGEGGMGEVRRCRDHAAGRDVALKVIRPEVHVDDVEERFLREARVQARLAHPAVVPVYDVGHDVHGGAYFTMKRIEGTTLDEVLSRLRDGDEDAAREYGRHRLLTAFARVCLAVDYAHSRGVLHRDLKPANIMLGAFGEVYVLDWGLAKIVGDEPERREAFDLDDLEPTQPRGRTERGVAMGTPAYMAPEQAAAREIDARADVFSLGAILFEILSYEQLLGEEEMRAVRERRAVFIDARPSIRAPSLGIPIELDAICMRATAPDPADRYPSARALHEAIEAFLSADEEENRRLRLAATHVERARELGTADAARPAALEELGAALALAPEDVEARRHLVELLEHPPKEIPQEVKERRLQSEVARRRRMQRVVATIFLLCWAAGYPLLVLAGGLRHHVGAFVAPAVWVAAALVIMLLHPRRAQEARVNWSALLCAIALATTSLVWGPLFIVPGLAVAIVFGHLLVAPKHHRLQIVVTSCLALVVPAYLAYAGILDVYRPVGDHGFVIDGAIESSRDVLFFGLTLCHFAQLAFGATFAARYRDILETRVLENALFSWQLANLVPRADGPRPRASMIAPEEDLLETAPRRSALPSVHLDVHELDVRYVRMERLATTSTTEVWRCRDRRLGREVEMHVARAPADDAAVRAQAKLRGRLEHPAIAPLYDVGVTEKGRAFFTTKFVDGVALSDALTTFVLPSASRDRTRRRLLEALGQVCLAVAYAHERGVTHGAISTSSIVLGSFGEVYLQGWTEGDAASDARQLARVLRAVLDASETSDPELLSMCVRAETPGAPPPDPRAIHRAIESFLSGDRDAEVRRQLARAHLERAQNAAQQAFNLPSFEEQAAARVEALREIGLSVRLDPEEPEAIRLLFTLLTEPPRRPPPAVVEEVERLHQERSRSPILAALLFGALCLLLYPVVVFMLGVRQVGPVLLVWAAWTVAEVTLLFSVTRQTPPSVPWSMFATMFACLVTALLSGPFFVIPVVATLATMGFVLVVPKSWRAPTMFLGALVVVLPAALEWAGVVSTIDMVDDVLVDAGPLAPASGGMVYLVLTIVHLLAVLFAAEYSARFRDRLDAVETAFLVRTWQLAKLLPQTKLRPRRSEGG